jgi:hypothetical protein
MDDLFEIFPDLPWVPGKAAAERVRERRERDARVRRVRELAERNAARFRAIQRQTRERLASVRATSPRPGDRIDAGRISRGPRAIRRRPV